MGAVAQPTWSSLKTCVCAARIIPTISGTLGIFSFWRLFFFSPKGGGRYQNIGSPKRISFLGFPHFSVLCSVFTLDKSVLLFLKKEIIYKETSKKKKAFRKYHLFNENNALQKLTYNPTLVFIIFPTPPPIECHPAGFIRGAHTCVCLCVRL